MRLRMCLHDGQKHTITKRAQGRAPDSLTSIRETKAWLRLSDTNVVIRPASASTCSVKSLAWHSGVTLGEIKYFDSSYSMAGGMDAMILDDRL